MRRDAPPAIGRVERAPQAGSGRVPALRLSDDKHRGRHSLAICSANAIQWRMKTATIPSVRVEPELREEVEQLLGEGESLSEFVEAAVRSAVRQRQNQAEFVARGLHSLSRARQTGGYVEANEALRKLDDKLSAAKARKAAAHS